MNVRKSVVLLALLVPLAACGSNAAPPTTAATEEAPAPTKSAAPTEAAPTSAAPEPVARKKIVLGQGDGGAGEALCTFFTAAEIGDQIGAKVQPGVVAGPMGSACQWLLDSADGGNVMIQTTTDEYWTEPKLDPGAKYKAVEGVGDQAYTAIGMFQDWTAAAKHDKLMTIVSINAPGASADVALAMLKETLARM
ncbi:hypothetical protein [Tenggerimyces flavus]|uniref:DUF5642 domain-containing protein n=1 Tax=Tenggerimyces flavus TaxID=1708749 RepID=A0ABV7YFX8_9ACTN|nr:hypothetical protein [Tenggerimyces flavus]MBM7789205.1 putative small lipoprotein YifL [Tenggerimyces flavus]